MKKDFPTFLKTQYAQKLKSNPRYSLRAFAQGLDIDQSLLTKVINGKRQPSHQFIEQVGRKLNIDPLSLAQFKAQAMAPKKFLTEDDFRRIQELDFEIISEWHHFAILELLLIKGFVAKPSLIAKCLNISTESAKKAIKRLLERGLVEQTGDTLRVTSNNNTWVNTQRTSLARKNLQKSLLEKAKTSIDSVPFELRENASLTLAFDSSKIEIVKKLIQDLKNHVLTYGEKQGNYDQVYQLVVGFYPLSHLSEGEI